MTGASARRVSRRGRPTLTAAQWVDRERAAGRLPAHLSQRQVAFLVDLVVRVREREVRAAQRMGVRRAGRPPGFSSAWNLSAAYHRKVPGGELYVVYGDAAAFATAPRFIVKYIKYFGADKGT